MQQWWHQVRQEGGVGGLATQGPASLRAPPSARNIKYARMYHFKKKSSKIFSPEGPCENVWGPHENVSLDPTVALDGPGWCGSATVGHQTDD